MNDLPEVLTVEEVAALLRVSPRTVYTWAQAGELPGGKVGATWRFPRDAVERWLRARLGGGHSAHTPLARAVNLASAWQPAHTLVCGEATTKAAVLDALAGLLAQRPEVTDGAALRAAIHHREGLMSTGIGLGIAVPHARLSCVRDVVMAGALCRIPIADYGALDDQPVSMVFMIAAGRDQHQEYIRLLAALSSVCKDALWRARLLAAPDAATFHHILAGREG